MKAIRAATVFIALCAGLGAGAAVKTFKEGYVDRSLIQTSGEPQTGTGKFWGYRSAKDGPGEDAFRKLLAKAKAEHRPLIAVWSNEDCIYCSRFVARLNRSKAEFSAWMKTTPALFGWFKGAGGKKDPLAEHGPAPCKEAYGFAVAHGAKPPWPYATYYHCGEDGKETVLSFSLYTFTLERFMASAGAFARRHAGGKAAEKAVAR